MGGGFAVLYILKLPNSGTRIPRSRHVKPITSAQSLGPSPSHHYDPRLGYCFALPVTCCPDVVNREPRGPPESSTQLPDVGPGGNLKLDNV